VSGWIVEFMQEVRHADAYLASICSSLFWVGMTTGRLTLGLATDRIGARLATLGYIIIAIVLQGLFALVESPGISAALVWSLGYFFGPMFPSGIVMMTRLLPKSLHVRAIALVAFLGQVGGACIPFGLGALADVLGLKVFQFTILAWLLVTLLTWLAFPRLPNVDVQDVQDVEDDTTRHVD
jgi:fucose permease